MSRQYTELRRMTKRCCDTAETADRTAMLAVRRADKILASIENVRGRLATLEQLVRQALRSTSGIRQR